MICQKKKQINKQKQPVKIKTIPIKRMIKQQEIILLFLIKRINGKYLIKNHVHQIVPQIVRYVFM